VALAAAGFFLGLGPAQAASQHKDKAPPQPTVQERFALCVACHGEGGVSRTALTPSLAGQPSFYAITQLFLFREGRRSNEAMSAVAKGMSDDDLRAFSDYIGQLPPPPPTETPADALRLARGAALAQRHHCAGCHGADYTGGKQVARLARQREDYLLQTLRQFHAAQRVGYTQAMNEALAGIPDEGLADLAHFLAHQP
jgi:cytochrome c553